MSQMKNKIQEKIILDKEQQKIIAELDKTIDRLEKELHEIKNIDKNHQRINGLLRKDVEKYTKENEQLKKENQIIREGNDYLVIYSTKLIDEVKKLNDDMTETIKVADISNCPVVISGGVSSIKDIKKVKNFNNKNIEGIIVGKAIYDGDIKLDELAKELD